jgi:serine/threonine-protein kinase
MSLASGLRLNNRFTLRELIGAGGMSQVWRAEDEVLDRPVAVKVLTAALAADPTLRSAVWTEARAAARLTHPHVTQVYDYGESALPHGGALPYVVMELVEGQSLADLLRSGPLAWPRAMAVAAQVASALAAAHRIGVVHRDIKPGNVMLTRTGVKVLDFGIAALVGRSPAGDGGRLFGTPAYAAPERLQPGPAAPASDVYSLGALLYQALTGRPPLAVATWQQLAAANHSAVPVAPPDVAGLPWPARRLCLACLSPDPADRPTAEEVERGLAAAAGQPAAATVDMPTLVAEPASRVRGRWAGPGTGAPPPYPPTMIDPGTPTQGGQPGAPPARRPPRALLVVLGAAVAVLAATALLLRAGLQSSGSPPAAQPPASATTSAAPSPTPSVASSSPVPTATSLPAIVAQLDLTIAEALTAGRIDADAADKLRDKINDLRASRNENKARRNAQEVQQRIDDLLADAKIDQQTAERLTTLLQLLTNRD